MVFNATFNNISVLSWRSVLLVEETGENHQSAANHWQTLSPNVVLPEWESNSQRLWFRRAFWGDDVSRQCKYMICSGEHEKGTHNLLYVQDVLPESKVYEEMKINTNERTLATHVLQLLLLDFNRISILICTFSIICRFRTWISPIFMEVRIYPVNVSI
jgi:hypothetical protein